MDTWSGPGHLASRLGVVLVPLAVRFGCAPGSLRRSPMSGAVRRRVAGRSLAPVTPNAAPHHRWQLGSAVGFALLLLGSFVSILDLVDGERAVVRCSQERCTLRRMGILGGSHEVGSYPRSGFHTVDDNCQSSETFGESGSEKHDECAPSLVVTSWITADSGRGEIPRDFAHRMVLDVVDGKLHVAGDATIVPIMARRHSWSGPHDLDRLARPGTYMMETGYLPWPLPISAAIVVAALLGLSGCVLDERRRERNAHAREPASTALAPSERRVASRSTLPERERNRASYNAHDRHQGVHRAAAPLRWALPGPHRGGVHDAAPVCCRGVRPRGRGTRRRVLLGLAMQAGRRVWSGRMLSGSPFVPVELTPALVSATRSGRRRGRGRVQQ